MEYLRIKVVVKKVLFTLLLSLVFVVKSFADNTCTVERVIDGDTFICSGKKIRLIGVDTPESSVNPHIQKQRGLGNIKTILYYGKLAKEFTKRLIPPGTVIRLEYDVQRYDRYGRTLAYIWLPDDRMLNEVLLKEGYAMLYTVPPNVKYEERFRKAYREAVEKGKGLWAKPYTFTNEDLEKYYGGSAVKKQQDGVRGRNVFLTPEPSGSYRCGEKRYCSEMSSCEEAMFYYKACGLKRLDGDSDGVPCENLCGHR